MNGTRRPTHNAAKAACGGRRPPGLVFSYINAQNPEREVTLAVGQRDIRIHRQCGSAAKSEQNRGIRKAVTGFSDASRRRLLFVARNLPGLEIMLTLTYPGSYPQDGRIVKNHWRRFRQWMVRNGAVYGLWVLEFQKRGAPHFHVFINSRLETAAASKAWYSIVDSGDSKHLRAGIRIERFHHRPALGPYLMKYAAKMDQKDVPSEFANVGRFWGTWGTVSPCTVVKLSQDSAKHLVRMIRRAHLKVRKDWKYRQHFRDNGRSGFMAWDSAPMVRRVIDDLIQDGVLHPS